MKKVEQIIESNVVIDYDEKLSSKELSELLKNKLQVETTSNPYICSVLGKEIKLLVKQITYLGNPHAIFKKRIQISRGWQELLQNDDTFLIGVYNYKQTCIFAHFDKENFKNRVTNNSSAHISTFDLLKASEDGIFIKKDVRGNIITAIRSDLFKEYLESLVLSKSKLPKEISVLEQFKQTLNTHYHGIDCYQQMIKDQYRNKFQPEWVGFYLEYKFESFLDSFPDYKNICSYQSNKIKGTIDLDVNFNNQFLGDLKAHSNHSGAILGNDIDNVNKALDLYGKIWYIVFSHDTEKDSEHNYEVTIFWNQAQNKPNLMSYASKMKNNIQFTDFKILEINKYNKEYLSNFNQGRNSNNRDRNPKIKINKSNINNFLIYFSDF